MLLPRLLKSPLQTDSSVDRNQMVSDWFGTPLGEALLSQEQVLLNEIMPRVFGYHLLYTGLGKAQNLVDACPIHHKIYAGMDANVPPGISYLPARIDQLPLQTDSMDAALLHHSLDFEDNPHTALREVTRAVMPGGKLIVVGFNPWSLWGLLRLFRIRKSGMPWMARFIGAQRVSDWAKLLDFEVEGCESIYYQWPFARESWSSRLNWLAAAGAKVWPRCGAVYVLVATKRSSCMTPIRPAKKARRQTLVPVPIAAPTNKSPRGNHRQK